MPPAPPHPRTSHRARKAEGREPSRKALATRRRILDAAAAQFAAEGYGATTLGTIAAAAGLHLSALYYHFDTKEALATEVVAHVPRAAAVAMDTALATLGPKASHRDRIGEAVRMLLRSLLPADNDYVRAGIRIGQQAPETVRAEAVAITRHESDVLSRLMQAAHRAGAIRGDIDPTMASMILFGAVNWTVEWFHPHGRLNVDQFADQLLTIFFAGVAPAADPAMAEPAILAPAQEADHP